MPWETSNRRAELPADWDKIRVAQLERDDNRCTWRLPSGKRCPRRATEVDHYGDKNDHTKLRSLCSDHHKQHTQSQARRARQKGSRRRRGEDHPGRVS